MSKLREHLKDQCKNKEILWKITYLFLIAGIVWPVGYAICAYFAYWFSEIDLFPLHWIIAQGCIIEIIGGVLVFILSKTKTRVLLGIGVAIFLVLGYSSSFMTKIACERRVARWVVHDVMEGKSFYVLSKKADPSLSIFLQFSNQVRVYKNPAESKSFKGFPWAEVNHASCHWLPFVVTVRYGWVLEPLYGGGGLFYFFCIPGYPIEIGKVIEWVA